MIDNLTLCPYSGLRSFTEEESLFFKGRDGQIDKIIRLLERNKFLMVTGASGEGKSSLIYAGLIPNARAGFFKAKNPNWTVVDFRPERTPLRNFARSLAEQFNPGQTEVFETEIRRGYSSLVELYKNSSLYANPGEADPQRGSGKRKNSNLLIIADQFEEFFTNPENFENNIPSEEAQIVVNLMLETAKISLMEDLPIYVVCTMRSDYIGQCTAFRGLPEYIGFSQFFVPRLKRNELQQVIEEPARLNGNRIARRLTERLLFDLSEGIDQLPILQHALSQIWLNADRGNEEMDLLHYARVGGMPADELPEADQRIFEEWFSTLPSFMRPYYDRPGIQRILEIHANRLYEEAWAYCRRYNPETEITVRDVKNCIALIFACLTKIDDTRAVRNRMSMLEITQIVNQPHITGDVITGIVNIFREEGNSFIRPYLLPDVDDRSLSPETVLDITHESLIRNWDRLKKWANKEYEYYADFRDFEKQLNRWLDHGKSSDYLLPLGPLSYFETWYSSCKPNRFWINRYEGKVSEPDASLERSATILENSKEFLKRSARKVVFARAIMRYGASRIVAIGAIVALVAMSSFYFYDAELKRNGYVLERLNDRSMELMETGDVDTRTKSWYLLVRERLSPGTAIDFLRQQGPAEQQELGRRCYGTLLTFDKYNDLPLKSELAALVDRSLEEQPDVPLDARNNFCVLLAYDYYYRNSDDTEILLRKNSDIIFSVIQEFLENPGASSISPADINMGINLYMTFGSRDIGSINSLIRSISPFETENSSSVFERIYPQEGVESNGRVKINYNGGYHTLAVLYASTGAIDNVKRCMDKLYENVDYFLGRPFNNYLNVVGYLYQYGHGHQAPEFVNWIAEKTSRSSLQTYTDFFDRAGFLKYLYASNIEPSLSESNAGYYHPNLSFLNPELTESVYDDFEIEINRVRDPNERNYMLALMNKQKAIFLNKHHYDRKIPIDVEKLQALLGKAVHHFTRTSEDYLSERVTVNHRYYGGGIRSRPITRRQEFIYPDYVNGIFSNTYYGDFFFRYMVENNLMRRFFQSREDLQLLNFWVSNYKEVYTLAQENAFKNDFPLPVDHYIALKEFIKSHPSGGGVDLNLINVDLTNHFFSNADTTAAMQSFRDINLRGVQGTANMFDYLNKAYFYNALKEMSIHLATTGNLKAAVAVSESFIRDSHRIQNYIMVADALYDQEYRPETFSFLDSAYHKMESIVLINLWTQEDFRFSLLYLLGKIGGKDLDDMSWRVLKSVDEWNKFKGIFHQMVGIAARGNYYQATKALPPNLTDSEELTCYMAIMNEEARSNAGGEESLLWAGLDAMTEHEMTYVFDSRGLN